MAEFQLIQKSVFAFTRKKNVGLDVDD